MFQLKLLDSKQMIKKKMLIALASEINIRLTKIYKILQTRLVSGMRQILKNTPEYRALNDGSLSIEFGFYRGEGSNRADALIEAIVRAMSVNIDYMTSVGATYAGGITVGVVRTDLSEIFSLPQNIIELFYKSKNYPDGIWLPWAEWLLLRGDEFIIFDYHISLRTDMKSRSGFAVMMDGGTWRVPPEFSGTAGDNWITRGIISQHRVFTTLMSKIIQEEITRGI